MQHRRNAVEALGGVGKFPGYQYVLRLVKVLFSADLNTGEASVCSLFDETKSWEFVNFETGPYFLAGCNRWNAVQVLQEEAGYLGTGGHLGLGSLMRLEGAAGLQAEAIEFSQIANKSRAIIRNAKERTLVDVVRVFGNSA